MGPDPGICPWIPIRLGCRQLPKASSAFSHAAILAPGTAAGSLHAPRKTLQTRPAHFSCPGGSRRPGSSWAPEPRDAASNPNCPKFLSRGPGGCSKFALPGKRPGGVSWEGGGGGRGRRAGRGRTREPAMWWWGGHREGEEQERAASALPFSKQRCHTRRARIFLGLWRES